MTPRITTIKSTGPGRYQVTISEPGRVAVYPVIAQTGVRAVDIARSAHDAHPLPASFLQRLTEAA